MKLTPDMIAKSGSESAHQKALFAQVAIATLEDPLKYACLQWLHAIPNGGQRTLLAAAKLKAEGVKAGVLDIFLPISRKGKYGLYIEMKAPGKIKNISKEQQEFIKHCYDENYQCYVCDNWQLAWECINNYID